VYLVPMCMTASAAELTNTHLYAGKGSYKGQDVRVIAYQNTAKSSGPNAMILPIPTREELTPENIIDTRTFSHFLKDITDPFQRRTRGAMLNSRSFSKSVQIFNSGSYTVVLAKDITDVPNVLSLLPEDRRPNVSQAFADGFKRLYHDWPVALCCWNGNVEAEPLLWWYTPTGSETLIFAPAMDSHDGTAPKPGAPVMVDHYVTFGSSNAVNGYEVRYSQAIPPEVRDLLPNRVRGAHVQDVLPNADFFMDPRTNIITRGIDRQISVRG
jgi:hypothetical protein